ncbi:MAG: FxLYD domain-containing protein [Candidatus Binataceae bacterium]
MRRSSMVILAVLVIFAAFIFYSLFHVSPVAVIKSRLERQDGRVFVAGELKNTGSKPAAIDLEVHYYNHDGRPIGQNKISVDNLAAGAVRDFRTPPVNLDGVSEFSLYLNHGRDPYGN